MTTTPALYLASKSPRRQEILRALQLEFSVCDVDTDESGLQGETPEQMVLRLAKGKVVAADVPDNALVLGADTAVVLGDRVLGKPHDEDDAVAMLLALSGRSHRVITGVALATPTGIDTVFSATDVTFRELGRDEAVRYWHSGEPRDKAGAYGIQGKGGIFVTAISGSYSGVVGLPVFETVELLRCEGIEVLEPGNPELHQPPRPQC